MTRFRTGVMVIALGLLLVGAPRAAEAGKYAIVLQAGTESHEGMARAVHALLYAQELLEHGHDVVLIFDGAGTTWAKELTDPESDSQLKPAYEALHAVGVTEIVCDYCANAFGVKGPLVERGIPLVSEYAGHPSIATWVDQGYQLIIL